ncbi:hypothetical protein SISSUDRAFT_1032926 [Sistotremastrum suecicum HHB10207 ss-3]|uniref:Copper acquisition factor BIM1-like domain-containing protein n=1 Tax=Sistotremastrum suecicum HHB10207 ss-3 TaxID=1314776 RepID=A0A166DZW0_9AGAM|nr:hypothetical protein SISSUDRAFT_1032926 [Sistotremastrum suecicum HHB10207 ss-3]
MKFFQSLLAASLVAAAVVRAHFTLDYPQTRGLIHADEPTPICGGFNNVTNRTEFPLDAAEIQINSHHTLATVLIEVAVGIDDPSSFSQFNTTSSGQTYGPLVPFNQIPEGPACYNVDISSLGLENAQNGTNATIVIIYDGGDGNLFQCADVTLVEGFKVPQGSILSNLTCLTITGNATSNATSTSSAPTSSPTSSSALTFVQWLFVPTW